MLEKLKVSTAWQIIRETMRLAQVIKIRPKLSKELISISPRLQVNLANGMTMAMKKLNNRAFHNGRGLKRIMRPTTQAHGILMKKFLLKNAHSSGKSQHLTTISR